MTEELKELASAPSEAGNTNPLSSEAEALDDQKIKSTFFIADACTPPAGFPDSVSALMEEPTLPAGYEVLVNQASEELPADSAVPAKEEASAAAVPSAAVVPPVAEASANTEAAAPRTVLSLVLRVLSLVGTVLLAAIIILLGVVWVLEKGPSPALTGSFARSVRETSALRWVSNIFLSEEELAGIISQSTEDEDTAAVNTSLIHFSEADAEKKKEQPYLQLIDISWGTCKGKLLIIRDPKSVILGTSGNFGRGEEGLQLTDMVAKYDGIAGINAGGFNDENGTGNGGRPQGLVIDDGVITWGSTDGRYNVIGIDYDGILHIGTMTGADAIRSGIRWGVSFTTHDGLASSLIINGEVQTQNLGGGVNPRTALGQREDGSLLLLVLDGRSINTLGATMENICDIMLEYGAVNAGNLDGGSSSVMVYNGEIINHCASVTGPRRIPTGFIVLQEENGND